MMISNKNIVNYIVIGSALISQGHCMDRNVVEKLSRPNIIHIMTDDHAIQAISAYGHSISKLAPTPNIDRLAREGMLFTRGYVENSISSPSRATLLTGQYSHVHGQKCLGNVGFDSTITVFPELLQKAGYQTAIIGKWHLPSTPKGFDYYKILFEQGEYYNPEFRTSQSNGKYVREEGYATTIITDNAIKWLEDRDKDRPFCLLLHHKAPHRNWMPESKYLELYEDVEFPYPVTFHDNFNNRSHSLSRQKMSIKDNMTLTYDLKIDQYKEFDSKWSQDSWAHAIERLTPEQRAAWDTAYNKKNQDFLNSNLQGDELLKWKYQRYIRDYMRCIRSIDEQIGRVLDYLKQNNLEENTIVVYTSDQGFYMGEHGWFDKRLMYEESFRMPLIIRYPKMVKAATMCEELVQNIDFAPTYLNIAGVKDVVKMAGSSLIPLLMGKTPRDWRDMLYYHYYHYPSVHMVRCHEGVSSKRYKLIHYYGKGVNQDFGYDIDDWELYDLKKDSTETQNLYKNPSYDNISTKLTKRLKNFRRVR